MLKKSDTDFAAAVSVRRHHRHLLFIINLFFLPFALYICWWHYMKNKRALNGSTRFIFQLKEDWKSSSRSLSRERKEADLTGRVRIGWTRCQLKLTWRKGRKRDRENTSSSSLLFFLLSSLFEDQRCCHVSLVPLLVFYPSAVRELKNKNKKNQILDFISLILYTD